MTITDPAVLAAWRTYELANERANRAYRPAVKPAKLFRCRYRCGCAFTRSDSRNRHERRFHPRLRAVS